MAQSTSNPRKDPAAASSASVEHRVGVIAKIDAEGRAHVHFPGGGDAPVLARSVLDTAPRSSECGDAAVGASVLLLLQHGDPALPIIVGIIREALYPETVLPELRLDLDSNRDVLVDGHRLIFEAQQEILLRCGKSTVLLQRDGRVLIRGTHLVSRSSGPNRIKGGSISLN